MGILCNNNRVCWVVFHLIKLLHSKHLSSFLQNFSMCRFRCGKQYTVQTPITRSLDNNFSLKSTTSRIFLLSFDCFLIFNFFFFFIFLLSCSALANCNISGFIYSRLYFPFIYEGTEICLNFKFCEKRGNTDLRAGSNWPSARESTQICTFTMAQQQAWARFGVLSKRNCYFWFRFRP